MKQFFLLALSYCLLAIACQKDPVLTGVGNGTAEDNDSIIRAGDKVMYEVITKDTGGWFGVWNDSTGKLTSNKVQSDNNGGSGPIYLPSGWTYTFICPNKPFQALISVAGRSYQDESVVNLYKNGKLIKSNTDNMVPGTAKLITTAETDSLTGTATNPVLTYEVLINDKDTSKYESDGWKGQWKEADGKVDDFYNPLLSALAIPSGWKYTFKPNQLPFTMYAGVYPYTSNAGTATTNLYVNGKLVKTASSRSFLDAAPCTYTVQ